MTDTVTTTAPDDADDADDAADAASASAFRWRLAHRPDVRFGHAAGGVAGILAAAAVLAFVIEVTDDDPTVPGVGFTLLLMAVAIAAGSFLRGPVRSAGVAALAVAIPQVWIFGILGDDGFERGDFRLILLLSVATYVAFYLLTWTRGRAVLLGLALLFAANWIAFEVATQDVPFALGVVDQAQSRGVDDPLGVLGDDNTTETGIAYLGIAVVLLGAGVALDRRGKAGAATPCLLVGGIYAVGAALTFGTDVDDVYLAGIFVLAAGLAIGLAGSLGRRRGTSWIGSIVLLAGVLTIVAQGTQDSVSGSGGAGVFGGFALLGAAALLVVGILVARGLAEPVDGGEPFVPPPAPEPEPVAPAPAPVPVGTAPEPQATAPEPVGTTPAPQATAPASDAQTETTPPVSWAAGGTEAPAEAATEPGRAVESTPRDPDPAPESTPRDPAPAPEEESEPEAGGPAEPPPAG